MARYWKFWAALAVGVVLQVAPVLVDALRAGLIPDRWVPWVHVVLAVATAAGVAAAPANAPAHRAPDRGGARVSGPFLAVAVLGSAGLLAAGLVAAAGPADAHDRGTRWIGVTSRVEVCDGVLHVRHSQEKAVRGEWTFAQDRGGVELEGHYVGAAFGPDGDWVRLPATYRTEGYLGWRVQGRGLPEQVRVVDTDHGVTSSPKLPQEGCTQE